MTGDRAMVVVLNGVGRVGKTSAALLLATEPVRRIPFLSFDPKLTELLRTRCLVHE